MSVDACRSLLLVFLRIVRRVVLLRPLAEAEMLLYIRQRASAKLTWERIVLEHADVPRKS